MKNENVFICYGRGILDDVVKRIAKDLRTSGYNVFLDKDYISTGDWETVIDEHIHMSNHFLFMASARSVSDAGYCLNELSRAIEMKLNIIPILIENVSVPLSINRFNRMSLVECLSQDGEIIETAYLEFINALEDILSGKSHFKFSDSDIRLKDFLKPVFSKDYLNKFSEFYGREEALKEFENFLQSNKNLFWINAGPGMGKTALSNAFYWNYPEYIKGIHFCKFNNSDRVNPKIIISSLAYQLAKAIPEYKEKLLSQKDMDSLFERSTTRIFEYLMIEVCSNIEVNKPVVLIIDALDECSWRQGNELCLIFQRMHKNIPTWMKFVITSRNEAHIRSVLWSISKVYVLNEENTKNDLRLYYKKQFPTVNDNSIECLIDKSEGSFLYATEIVKQIKEENLSIDNIDFFPVGIYGFYNDCFSRIFGQETSEHFDFACAQPIIEILCVTPEPANVAFLTDVLEMETYEIKNILARLSGLFPINKDYIEPLHKSLIDWLTYDDICQNYYVSRSSGYRKLLNYMEKIYKAGEYKSNLYVLKYFGKILIELKELERLYEVLSDYEFISSSIYLCEFDSGIENYLEFLSALPEKKRLEIFESVSFIRIFAENRRLLYNSGMFFKLKELGFTKALRLATNDWGIEGEIGKAFYYYIVEDFRRAIKTVKALAFNNADKNIDNYILAEAFNVKGLSERKLVLFDSALESFEKVIELLDDVDELSVPLESDMEFELSLAHLIKSKIFLTTLKFSKCNSSCRNAIKILQRRIEDMEEGTKKTSNILFLAEEYRVAAYGYIWQEKFEFAEQMLAECEDIYTTNSQTSDRYFVRYKYTALFLQIMQQFSSDNVYEQLENLRNEVVSLYDKGQLDYLCALDIYINHRNDQELVKKGLKCAYKGAEFYDTIDAKLEKNECILLTILLSDIQGKESMYEYDEDDYISEWIEYIKSIITKRSDDNE